MRRCNAFLIRKETKKGNGREEKIKTTEHLAIIKMMKKEKKQPKAPYRQAIKGEIKMTGVHKNEKEKKNPS